MSVESVRDYRCGISSSHYTHYRPAKYTLFVQWCVYEGGGAEHAKVQRYRCERLSFRFGLFARRNLRRLSSDAKRRFHCS
jgi:hypothetical protein